MALQRWTFEVAEREADRLSRNQIASDMRREAAVRLCRVPTLFTDLLLCEKCSSNFTYAADNPTLYTYGRLGVGIFLR